jgi:hypothetical protein
MIYALTGVFLLIIFAVVFSALQIVNNVTSVQKQKINKQPPQPQIQPQQVIVKHVAEDAPKPPTYSQGAGLPSVPTRPTASMEFQQVGILYNSDNQKVLPLYGKQLYRNSNKWNYYTSTDGYHSMRLGFNNKNKDCMDEYGCEELYDKDTISLPEIGQNLNVKLYNKSGYQYNPDL